MLAHTAQVQRRLSPMLVYEVIDVRSGEVGGVGRTPTDIVNGRVTHLSK